MTDFPIRPEQLVPIRRAEFSAPTAGPRELVAAALERPHGFEPMRRAMTPDDRVVIVLDESLPQLTELIAGVLEHLATAGVGPDRVTLLTPPGSKGAWIDDLPDEFADVHAETHDPTGRTPLAYLATTTAGRLVYLNRTLVDADFVVLLTGRGYDPRFGHGGAGTAVFPTLSDAATRTAAFDKLRFDPPTAEAWPLRAEAEEVLWLLGTQFLVQVIPGAGDTIHEAVAGLADSAAEGIRRHDLRWRGTVDAKADVVIAAVTGTTFADFAAAANAAVRVVEEGGSVVLVSDAEPVLTEGAAGFARAKSPRAGMKSLLADSPGDWLAAAVWARAAEATTIRIFGPFAAKAAGLFAKPLDAEEVRPLVGTANRVIVIPDAQRSLVEVVGEGS